MWNTCESKIREAVASSDRSSNGILRGGVPRRFTKVSRRSATTGLIALVAVETRLVLCTPTLWETRSGCALSLSRVPDKIYKYSF